MKLEVLIVRNKAKLEQMINDNVDYKKILYQSKRLDNYILKMFKEQNRINL